MAKRPLSFRDFMVVDYTPGMPEQISWNAKKRRRGVLGGLDESLTIAQRRGRSLVAKRIKAKLAMGRKRAEKRTADSKVVMKRARRLAINIFYKKLAKGVPRDELSVARRQEIETRLERMKGAINRLARKLIPRVREIERMRKQGTKPEKTSEKG